MEPNSSIPSILKIPSNFQPSSINTAQKGTRGASENQSGFTKARNVDYDSLIDKYLPKAKDTPSLFLHMRIHDNNYQQMVDNL